MNSLSLCRLCLTPNKSGNFGIIFALHKSYDIIEHLRAIANVAITENDGYPQLICGQCIMEMDAMHGFITKCQNSDHLLKRSNANFNEEDTFDEMIEMLDLPTEDVNEGETMPVEIKNEHQHQSKSSKKLLQQDVLTSNTFVETTLSTLNKHTAFYLEEHIMATDPLAEVTENREPNYTQCCGCIEHFANFDELEAHSRYCHLPDRAVCGPVPEKQIECRICYKVFSALGYLDTLHRLNAFKGRLHALVRPKAIQCCSCETICNDLTELSAHANEVHLAERIVNDLSRPHECIYCYKRYTRKQALSYHQKYSYSYKKLLVLKRRGCRVIRRRMETEATGEVRKCCGCFAEFLTEEALRQHSHMHHKLYRRQEEPLNDSVPDGNSFCHECDICYKQFPTPLKLELHKSIPYNRTHRCTECSREFIKQSLLENHLRKVHPTAEQSKKTATIQICKPSTTFQCEECGVICKSRYLLQSHRKLHTDHKPFMCTLCNERFKRKQNLQSHLRKHTGERPYRCRYCAKVFGADADKKRHEITQHTHKFELQCEDCGMGFVRKRTYEQHRKRMHDDESKQETEKNSNIAFPSNLL